MFDIGWSELLVIGVVALIIVGPKELPKLFRTVGQFVGKARGMAREFQRAMDRAADEAGVKDVKETFQEATKTTSFGFDDIRKTLNSSTLPNQKKPKPVDAAREHAEKMKDKGEIKGNGSENSIAPTEEPTPQPATEKPSDAKAPPPAAGANVSPDADANASSDSTSPTGEDVVQAEPGRSTEKPADAGTSDRVG